MGSEKADSVLDYYNNILNLCIKNDVFLALAYSLLRKRQHNFF